MAGSLRNQGPLNSLAAPVDRPDVDPDPLARVNPAFDPNQPFNPKGDFRRGLDSAALGIQEGELLRAADQAELEGDIASRDWLIHAAQTRQQEAAALAPRVGSYADVHGVGDAIDYVQGGLGQAVPSMALSTGPGVAGAAAGAAIGSVVPGVGNLLGATIGGLLAGGYQSYELGAGEAASQQHADEYIRNLPVEERIKEQRLKGLGEMFAEQAVPALIGGRLWGGMARVFSELNKAATKEAAKAVGKAALKRGAKGFAEDTLGEAATEGVQAKLGQMSLQRLNPNRDTTHDLQELIDSTIFGALSGGAMSLGTTVPSALVQGAIANTKGEFEGAKAATGAAVDAVKDRLKRTPQRNEDIPDDTIGPGGQPPVSRDIPDSEIGEMTDPNSPIARLAAEIGVPLEYAELSRRVSAAEKDNDQKIRDPVTGKMLTALELMDQLESEGLPRMGEEFSKRRGYTPEEWADFVRQGEMQAELMDGGIREDDLMYFDGVLDGQLPVPEDLRNNKAAPNDVGKDIPDEEIGRQSRVRKSMLGVNTKQDSAQVDQYNATQDDFELKTKYEADAEEITGLRELKSITKEESKGQSRRVARNPTDIETFLKRQVDRGVITQEVADSATVEPLGQRMKREGASEQEMENEIASIVRDLLTRITNSKDPDFKKGLTSELERLPIDVQRVGEKTLGENDNVEYEVEDTVQMRPGVKKDSKQGDLFPDDRPAKKGTYYAVPLKRFKKNHFGLSVVPLRTPEQMQLALRSDQTVKVLQQELAALEAKKSLTARQEAQAESLRARIDDLTHNPDPSRRDLLARALDNYVAVLASDAAASASAATEQDTKAGRKSLESMTEEERKAAGKTTIAFRLKNGQTRNLDMDDMINNELRKNREEVQGQIRDEGKIREAAFRSAVAAELLRNDVEGILDQSTGEKSSEWSVAQGSRVEDLLGQYIAQRDAAVSPARAENQANESQARQESRGIVGKDARPRREDHPYIRDLKSAALRDRQAIQRAFEKAKKELGKEADLRKPKSKESTPAATFEGEEALKRESKVRKQQIKSLKAEAKRVRDVVAQADKLSDEMSYLDRVKQVEQEQGIKRSAAYKVVDQMLRAAYGKEVADLMKNFPQKSVARFRADRLSALAEHLQELENEMARERQQNVGKEEIVAEQTESKKARNAEEQTGAGEQLKVGTPMRGQNRQQKVSNEAARREQAKIDRLKKRLTDVDGVRERARMLSYALGWHKDAAPNLLNYNTGMVLLGNTAKGLRTEISQTNDVVGTRDLLTDAYESPYVIAMAAKNEMDGLVNTNEFRQLMSAGKQIVMPGVTEKLRQAMIDSGYIPQQLGKSGMVVWKRDLGMHADTKQLADETFVGTPLASLSKELQSDMVRWNILHGLGEAFGKMGKKVKDAAESKALEAARKWVMEQVRKGVDIEVLYDKIREKIANSDGPIKRAWERVLEWIVPRQKELAEEINRFIAELKEAGSEAALRKMVRMTFTVEAAVQEMMATGAYAINDKNEAALTQWVKDNYDDLVEIVVRREMLNRTSYMEEDHEFSGNRLMQAKFLRNLLGPEAAKRIAVLSKTDKAKLDQRLEILLDGKVFTQGMYRNAPRHVQHIMWYMRNVAPNQQTTLDVSAYFNDLAANAAEIVHALGGKGSGVLMPDQKWSRVVTLWGGKGQIDSVTGMHFGENIPLDKMSREELITELFGKEYVGKTWDQLMDVPLKLMPESDVWASNALVGQAKRRREVYLTNKLSPQSEAKLTHSAPYWMHGMTLRSALSANEWLDTNIDKLDIQFTQDEEKLKGTLAPGTGAMGLYSPSDDRIFLMPGAMRNRFSAGWTAWHELYHRGVAVHNKEQVTAVLEKAGKNPTIKKIAKAISLERAILGDHNGAERLGAIEEALVELGAAIEHNNFDYLKAQYGVEVSENLKQPLQQLWEEFKEIMRAVMQKILAYDSRYDEMKSDLDVLRILQDARNAALGSPTDRRGALNAAFAREGVDPSRVRLSRQSDLEDALNTTDRAERENAVAAWLADKLGPRINVIFQDITNGQDGAGSFDWKTATIKLAMNTVHWQGVMRHEAFHAFFQRLGQMDQGREVYNRLLKASRAPHIKAQLRKLLANQPDALAQLRDPEERLAYMFQFYSEGKLTLQGPIKQKFKKWAENLARIVGYVSAQDQAERIFSAFNSGLLKTDEQIMTMMRQNKATGLTKAINEILNPTKAALLAVLTSATDRLRATNNQSLKQIADLFWKDPKMGGKPSFITLRGQRETQFMNWFNDVLDEDTADMTEAEREDYLLRVLDDLQSQRASTNRTVKRLRASMKRLYMYLADTDSTAEGDQGPNSVRQLVGIDPDTGEQIWEPIRYEGDRYFPRIWDLASLDANWEQFVQEVQDEGGPGLEALEHFRRALRAGDGMLEMSNDSPTFDAAMRSINSRTFTFITEANAHKFAKYQQKDLSAILTTYARQAAHRGEATRQFGYKNQVLEELLKDAKAEGATKKEMEMADKAIRALHGTLGSENMTPMKRGLMLTAMTAVNFAVLPLALFSSLVDPMGVMVRTGEFKDAVSTFKTSVKTMMEDIKATTGKGSPDALHAERVKLARMLGIIEQEQVLSVIGDSYHGMFMGSGLKKWNERFFKAIGLDSWTKGTRIGAMVAVMEYMKDNHDNAEFLAEVGLEAGDIVVDSEGKVEIRPSELGSEKARRVQAAIYRMVDEAILRPTAGQRPIYMSDMRLMLLGHLKQFTFSFHNTIVKQVAKNVSNELDQQAYFKAVGQLTPLLMYVPFMMAADVLRSVVGGRIDDDDREPWEYMADSIQRSGVLGVGTFALDAADDFAYSGVPINTMLGPVVHKGGRLIESALDPDERFVTQAKRMLPGYAFWKGWLE